MNQIVAENARPGTADWRLDHPATAREIEGYAGATSVNRGDVIRLYVNTQAAAYALEVFRMGWYQGLGARRVFGPVDVPGTRQAMPEMDPATGLVDCAWVNPFELSTRNPGDPADWPAGFYLARLSTADLTNRREDDRKDAHTAQSYILFVVRDDARRSELMFQLSVTTYQAYNAWGGKSLYRWGSSGRERAAKVFGLRGRQRARPGAGGHRNPRGVAVDRAQ